MINTHWNVSSSFQACATAGGRCAVQRLQQRLGPWQRQPPVSCCSFACRSTGLPLCIAGLDVSSSSGLHLAFRVRRKCSPRSRSAWEHVCGWKPRSVHYSYLWLCSFDMVCFFDRLQHVLVGGESGSSYSSGSRPLTPTAAEEYARCRHAPRTPRRICPFLQVWPGCIVRTAVIGRHAGCTSLPPLQQPLQHSPGIDPGL